MKIFIVSSAEDWGKSPAELEYWEEYLADFPEEPLLPVQMSTNGSISEGDFEGNENISRMDYGEAYIYDPLEDWITNPTVDHDLEVQSNIGIVEQFLGDSISLEAPLAAISPKSGMDWVGWSKLLDWVEWSKLMDEQLSNEKVSEHFVPK